MVKKVPISEPKKLAGCTGIAAVLFGLPFFLLGCFFFYMIWIQPALLWRASKSWPSVQAKVVESRVEVHSGSDGSTYSPEITYKYAVNGREYENDQYGLSEFSTSGNWARNIVREHPVNSHVTIWYNPSDPGESMLNREMGWLWLIGLLPLLFVAVGVFFIFFLSRSEFVAKKISAAETGRMKGLSPLTASVASSFKRVNDKSSYEFQDDVVDREFDKPLKLQPESSRIGMFIGASVFALIWNGISWFMFFQLMKDGFGDWFGTIFLVPFLLIGFAVICFCFYAFLSLFNPKVEIAMSNGLVPCGGEVDLAWEVKGNVNRFRNFIINVEGEEISTYRRGTSTYTDKETFKTIPVVETISSDEMQFGSSVISIPEATIHSMDLGDNKIKWTVNVRGDIPWWPDVIEKLEFRVKP